MDWWTMRWRAAGRLRWKSLATFPAHVPSPTNSSELYPVWIESEKVKTHRITGQPTGTRTAPLVEEPLLSKQTGPPLLNEMIKFIALLGEYTPTFAPHASTNAAIEHSRSLLSADISATWVSTEDIDLKLFERYSGIWVAPGSPYKSMEKTLWAIRYARENNIPCFGTCGGFQHIVIEYARNVLGFKDAQHAEYDPYASTLFISQLACSLAGREMPLSFVPGSQVAAIYGGLSATEHYYCNFGVNPDCIRELKRGPLSITGADIEGEVRVIEYPGHPFFIGTLFVPQTRSKPEIPHPLVTAFLRAVVDRAA